MAVPRPQADRAESVWTKIIELHQSVSLSHQKQHFRCSIGDVGIQCETIGEGLFSKLTRALRHLPQQTTDRPSTTSERACLRIYALDCSLLDGLSPRQLVAGHQLKQQQIPDLCNERFHTSFDLDSEILTLYCRSTQSAYLLAASAENLALHTLAAPFVGLFHLHFRRYGLHLLHAAALEKNSKAILLCGRGGLGKSTTALSCLAAGFGYIGDDYCAFELGKQPMVYSLYSSAKVFEDSLDRLQTIRPFFTNRISKSPAADPATLPPIKEKHVSFLYEHCPGQLRSKAPLTAILIPSLGSNTEVALKRVSSVEALTSLAPSSMFQLPEPGAHAFQSMVNLARAVPAYRLALSSSAARTAELVQEIVG